MRKTILIVLILIVIAAGWQWNRTRQAAAPEMKQEIVPTEQIEPIPAETDDERDTFKSGLIPSRQSLPNEMQNAPTYRIELEIADDIIHVNGHQAVTYTNTENTALNEIYFHLFPNFLGESMSIENVRVDGEETSFTLEASDTVLHVPFSTPLQIGESTVIEMDFLTIVPTQLAGNYGTLAYTDGILSLAHAYPAVAVYDDEGWNIDIPDIQGDVTYLDAGFYLVQVNAPKDLVLAASGNEIRQQSTSERQIVTYASGPARDFYLAGSADYVKTSQSFGDYTINSYAPENLSAGSQMAIDVSASAIQLFSERYAPYPYTEFDIVATPTLALGIEYPGMTAINIDLYDLDANFSGTPAAIYLETTVVHEVGHQWFYNQVGNDQLDDPWLDESLVQYITWQYFLKQYGEQGGAGFENSLDQRWDRVAHENVPLGLPVRDYEDSQYGAIIYGRGAFFFDALKNQIGQENFTAFMSEYTQSQQWEIATTESLRENAETACDCDLEVLFDDWVYPDG